MKKIYRIFTLACAVAVAAACDLNKMPEFDDNDAFAAFDVSSYSYNETQGRISIPVTIASVNPVKTSVTYELVSDESCTAVEGTDFKFVDNTGVLSFDGQKRTATIDIDIVDLSGVYTGDKSFSISLKSATGINIGAEKTCTVTIMDLDHPLADILGNYTVACTDYYNGACNYTMTLSKDPDDVSIVWCNAIAPMGITYKAYGKFDVWGTVSEDHSTIVFDAGQKPGVNLGYGSLVLVTYDEVGDCYETGTVTMTRLSDGTFSTTDSYGFVDDMYYWYGGLVLGEINASLKSLASASTTWTKQ